MNYQESEKILREIRKANKILLNCHQNPDPDAIGCALAMFQVLKDLGKEPEIICPTQITGNYRFLKNFDSIKTVDFGRVNFFKYDLFFSLDSSSWAFASGLKGGSFPPLPVINIDHHLTNENFGVINLVDKKISSCAEVLYRLFSDWQVEINREIAEALLTGIMGDTGIFKFPSVTSATLRIAAELIEKGADREKIILNLFQNYPLNEIKFWGYLLTNLVYEEKFRFVWSAANFETYVSFGKPGNAKEDAASQFAQSLSQTDFGIIMVETKKKKLSISIRGKNGFDVSRVARELGGGGHLLAAGAVVEGLPFAQAVEKVLAAARKYAKKVS